MHGQMPDCSISSAFEIMWDVAVLNQTMYIFMMSIRAFT